VIEGILFDHLDILDDLAHLPSTATTIAKERACQRT